MANVLRICPGEVADEQHAFFSRVDVMISRSDRIGFKTIGHVDLSLLGINFEKKKDQILNTPRLRQFQVYELPEVPMVR